MADSYEYQVTISQGHSKTYAVIAEDGGEATTKALEVWRGERDSDVSLLRERPLGTSVTECRAV